ncbi:MAG: TIGR04282 family arsenosugar biosynthesis glycosyltransferase [Cytophagales bacterium]|nr:TIGR04282 family arsenosugar biosynthesis glycosyltransferase [Cytophagales bacterium]
MSSDRLLILFLRNFLAGSVKTRLIPRWGKEGALEIYKRLVQRTHQLLYAFPGVKHVFYDRYVPHQDLFSSSEFDQYVQSGHDLGERMDHAFSHGFSRGMHKIVIVGSDCYDLEKEHLELAFSSLDRVPYVLGPARDGGYYLLGMTKPSSFLFQHTRWSHARVLEEALEKLKQRHENYKLLPSLMDIDTPEDVERLSKRGITLMGG